MIYYAWGKPSRIVNKLDLAGRKTTILSLLDILITYTEVSLYLSSCVVSYLVNKYIKLVNSVIKRKNREYLIIIKALTYHYYDLFRFVLVLH